MLHNQEAFFHTLGALPEVRLHGFQPQKCELRISMLDKVRQGLYNSRQYQCQIRTALAKSHVLTDVTLQESNQISCSYVTCADLDPVECKYILVGKNSGGLAIFDATKVKNSKSLTQVGRIKGGVRGTHLKGVTCVQWYPVDAGLFTTSSSDYCIKVWDPNFMKKVDEFKLDCQPHHHHMSPLASKHSLIAVAGEKGEVILCDLRSGSSSHRLHGHDGPVQVVQWTRHDQNFLASGGRDKTIRLWDVRAGKSCLKILDSENATEEIFRYRKRIKNVPMAHSSRITSLCYTHDGLWLVSFSFDGCLKVWNTLTGENMCRRFGSTYTDIKRALSMAVTYNLHPDLIYVPSKSKVFVYEVTTGALVNILSGHFSTVLGTLYNPYSGDVYSYGTDRNFLVWTPERFCPKEDDEVALYSQTKDARQTADAWSSDDD